MGFKLTLYLDSSSDTFLVYRPDRIKSPIYTPDWPKVHRDPPVSVSEVLA